MLGKIDFANAPQGFEPVPAGDYPGVTKSWEAGMNSAGDGKVVKAQFRFEVDDPLTGETKNRIQFVTWSLKNTALWRIKRDLVDMGVDPQLFQSTDVDLAAILNDVFSQPLPVTLTLSVEEYTPNDGPRDENGEIIKRKQNRLERVKLRTE